jgi:hypothetical protein
MSPPPHRSAFHPKKTVLAISNAPFRAKVLSAACRDYAFRGAQLSGVSVLACTNPAALGLIPRRPHSTQHLALGHSLCVFSSHAFASQFLANAAQMFSIVLAGLDARKRDGLITDDAVRAVGGCGVEAPCVYV